MYSYMPELLRTFFDEPVYEELEREITACRQSLEHQLDQTGRKELLQLVDLENERSDRLVFEAFLPGFVSQAELPQNWDRNHPFPLKWRKRNVPANPQAAIHPLSDRIN